MENCIKNFVLLTFLNSLMSVKGHTRLSQNLYQVKTSPKTTNPFFNDLMWVMSMVKFWGYVTWALKIPIFKITIFDPKIQAKSNISVIFFILRTMALRELKKHTLKIFLGPFYYQILKNNQIFVGGAFLGMGPHQWR